MSQKIIEIDLDNIDNFILKSPKESKRSTAECPEYVGEIWYIVDDKAYIPVIQTPRLKVKYGAKRYNANSVYSYCLSMYNYDIDPQIKRFYDFVQALDKHLVKEFSKHKGKVRGVKNKYWTAMRRKTRESDPHFVVKLIQDKEGTVMTTISDTQRESRESTDIVFGCYTDQYISPSYIVFNNTGMYPCWNAHQVVVGKIEKVFLESCLLDEVSIEPPPVPVPPPMSMYSYYAMLPPSAAPHPPLPPPMISAPRAQSQSAPRVQVQEKDLLAAISKLKKAEPGAPPVNTPLSLIRPDDLLKKKQEIQHKARAKIMYDSIKDLPIEGVL